jgi:hypothetical protein
MNVNVEHLDNQTFEDLCNELLRREVGSVTSIDGSGGDKGVDGFRGKVDGEVTIYQHKFYDGRLNSSRKRKIIESFETAVEEHPEMSKWVLLIATEFTHGEQEWFEENVQQTASDVEVECWNKKEIEGRLIEYETLVHRFFPNSMLSLGQRQQELVNYLSAPVVEKTSMLYERLNEIKEDNPHLDVDFEYSTEDDVQKMHFKPDSNMSINTELSMEEEQAAKIRAGDEVHFDKEQVGNIEFNPSILPEDDFELDELVLKPWYSEWEKDVQIEIPGGGFKKQVTITIEDVSEDAVLITTQDSVFDLTLHYNPDVQKTEVELSTIFKDKKVYRVAEFLDFINQLETESNLLIRDLEEGEPVFTGRLETGEIFEGREWFENVINKLELIESHVGESFTLTKFVDEEEEIHILTISELLREGEAYWPFSMSPEVIEGKEEELFKMYEQDDTELTVEMNEFYIPILDQEIEIGDIKITYPNPELPDPDVIRDKIERSEPVEFRINPSEDATVQLLEAN